VRRKWLWGGFALGFCAAVAAWWPGRESVEGAAEAQRRASIYPDYAGVTVPVNIAPLNIVVREPGEKFCLRLTGTAGRTVEVFGGREGIRIPARAWGELLRKNAGGALRMDVYAKGPAGWTHFDAAGIDVAAEEIDGFVVYRYFPPIYDKWGRISIRQRALGSFDERVLIDNEQSRDASGQTIGNACVNCHTFWNHKTSRMLMHLRPGGRAGQAPAMIVVKDGRASKVDTRVAGGGAAAYSSWHPSGKLIAFSRNSFLQFFHSAGEDVREVVDRDSDLGLCDVESGRVYTAPQISRPDRLETWPAWSPDGRYLYFASARQLSNDRKQPPPDWAEIRYDLARASYDPATGRWGEAETVVAASELGQSVSMPAVSPDGRFVMFTGHPHGSFPTFQTGSDLYLADLAGKGGARRLDEINSPRAEGYHSWSSNGRWVVFSSKREDGVFTRLYIAHLDAAGRFGKPFLLPQEDPWFYGRCLMSFNRPELIGEPVGVSSSELARAANETGKGEGKTQESVEPYLPLR
jgi:hypothetical protein